MPDFFGLADQVISKLRVQLNHPACKILAEAREMETRTGVSGLISADRVFGLLERDFPVNAIETAVAQALKPADDVDLSAHRIILNLATTPEGKVRLVTTNFERLFEACSDKLTMWQPPRLPDPSRHNEMDGIIHLHGCATAAYSGAEGDGFVLSSSNFGRAYLSDGWATEFFREILARYVVVFVGYTADDPPVQYLLEALNIPANRLHGIYAFQAGSVNEVSAKWLHKGVEAIPYANSDDHRALWETLSAWAERAKAPDDWLESVIVSAKRGPQVLEPHVRGQVAHFISSVDGARRFSESDPPPPGEWLCVFDPFRRYATPDRISMSGEEKEFIDPFDAYGLDSDIAPQLSPEDRYRKRDVPVRAWDGFAANRLDRQNLRDANFSSIRGQWSTSAPSLPSRLDQLGRWIARVADQPASVWWAANQAGLHDDVQKRIRWELERSTGDASPVMRQAWQYLFEAWRVNEHDSDHDWYELKRIIDKDGWDRAAFRRYAAVNRPYLKADSAFWGRASPPSWTPDISVQNLMRLEVVYPDTQRETNIPDEWLSFAVRELRNNLEHALHLEQELGGHRLVNISPIVPVTFTLSQRSFCHS